MIPIRTSMRTWGLRPEQLAKRSGVSQGYIAKLEPSNRPGRSKEIRHHNPWGERLE